MLAYHVFRDDVKAHPGMSVNYLGNGEPGGPFLMTMEQYRLVNQYYPQGVSRHGFRYLNPADKTLDSFTSHAIETVFELVRLTEFPDRLSRFQSAFACPTLESAQQWVRRFGQGEIWSVEVDDHAPQLDASFLRIDDNGAYSHVRAICNARSYWNGCYSENPELEILVPLPFSFVNKIT